MKSEIVDKICSDKKFSKEIQEGIDKAKPKEFCLFFLRIESQLGKLMENIYGNYLMQNLILKSN